MNYSLKGKFSGSNYQRFLWQTENDYIREKEQILLEEVSLEINQGNRILEIGCGEGANLVNLAKLQSLRGKKVFGLDFFYNLCWQPIQSKYNFVFLCGDGRFLPFQSEVFDTVFFKDVLHHLTKPEERVFLKEILRVVKPTGKIILIEANGKNLIMRLFSFTDKSEHRLRQISAEYIEGLLAEFNRLKTDKLTTKEETAFFRVLLHYKFGFPFLAKQKRLLSLIEKVVLVIKYVLGLTQKAYVVGVIRKNGVKPNKPIYL